MLHWEQQHLSHSALGAAALEQAPQHSFNGKKYTHTQQQDDIYIHTVAHDWTYTQRNTHALRNVTHEVHSNAMQCNAIQSNSNESHSNTHRSTYMYLPYNIDQHEDTSNAIGPTYNIYYEYYSQYDNKNNSYKHILHTNSIHKNKINITILPHPEGTGYNSGYYQATPREGSIPLYNPSPPRMGIRVIN